MASSPEKPTKHEATQIECLACGARRLVTGRSTHDTGECPSCRYLGWTYSDELDGATRHAIMNGAFALNEAGPTARFGTARGREFA
jgi:hypothetical protein